MASPFADRECFDGFPVEIPDYDWFGEVEGEPEAPHTGVDFPLPPPFDVTVGCPCPTSEVTINDPGDTPSGDLTATIVHRDDDCCANDFIFDFTPPCISTFDVTTNMGGVLYGKGGSFNASLDGDGCNYDLFLDLNMPCPTGITPVIDSESDWSSRDGALEVTVNEDACEFDIIFNIDWPCPTQINQPVVTNNRNWDSRDGASTLTITPVEDACEWDCELTIDWPCPTRIIANLNELHKWNSVPGYRQGEFNVAVVNPFEVPCDWQLDFEVKWPCPPAIELVDIYNRYNWNYDYETDDPHRRGSLTMTLQHTPEMCEWSLGGEIEWPCPPKIEATTTVNNEAYDQTLGDATLSIEQGDACDWTVGLTVDWPCPTDVGIVNVVNNPLYEYYGPPVPHPDYGDLRATVTKDGNCGIGIDFEIDWPCPSRWNYLGTTNNYLFSNGTGTQLGSLTTTFNHNQAECTWELGFDVDWPCPPIIGVNSSTNSRAWDERDGNATLSVHKFVGECKWALNLDVEWPCPTSLVPSFTNNRNWSERDGTGYLNVHKTNCEFHIDLELNWPCPFHLTRGITDWESTGFPPLPVEGEPPVTYDGSVDLVLTPTENDCTYNVDLTVTTPCTDVLVTLDPRFITNQGDNIITTEDNIVFQDDDHCARHMNIGIDIPEIDFVVIGTGAVITNITFQPLLRRFTVTKGDGGGNTSSWWGKIMSLNVTTGIGKARKVTGTYPSGFNLTADTTEYDVIVGVGAMHYCPEGGRARYALFISSGQDITPAWTAIQHLRVGYTEPDPDTELHTDQDNGGGPATCGA